MRLEEIRTEIDELDDEILKLFLRRMELGKAAMQAKKLSGKQILDRSREREILKSISEKSGELSIYSRRLFKELMSLSRSYQSTVFDSETELSRIIENSIQHSAVFPKSADVACQGIEGAYSQQAADKLFSQGNIKYFESFEDVCAAVKSGKCEYGVLPIENSSNGSVHAVYELLKSSGLSIVRSVKLCIHHELLAKPGTKLSDIHEIISHEQAIGQCSRFLKGLDNKAQINTCANTALAAKIASESDGVAAISSPNCAALYGLTPIVKDSIQNSENNYTRFICVAAKPEIFPGANRISFLASCRHEPGEFCRLVSIIGAMDVNIAKLESMPIVGRDFEFLFFFNIEASVLEPGIIGMLEEIQRSSESFVFLGNYQEI